MSQVSVFLRHAKRNHNTNIDLSHRNLLFIPKQLLTLRNVEQLNLSNNKLQSVQHTIGQLYKLKQLDLSYNMLTQIPIQISTMPMLSVLKLQGNPLSAGYQILLQPGNSSGQKLSQALKTCFQKQMKQQAPAWLIEGSTKNLHQKKTEIQWDEKIFKVDKVSRKTDRTAKKITIQQKQLPTQFKNGILQIKLDDLEIGQQISMGGFSTIHRGKYCGIDVAVKKIFNPNINQQLMNQFNNQLVMLSRYRHPNIVLLIGAVTVPPTLCIVMEHCKQGTLFDLLHKKKTTLLQKDKTRISLQILLALQFLHKHGIVHRDIKSHNILINSQFQVKLCDFGLAKHKSQLNTGPMQYSGTPTYMSQQMFLKKSYDMSVDVFALGTMLYQLYSSQIPYHGIDPSDIKDKVLKDSNLPHKLGMKKSISQLINRCRLPETYNRPTIQQLVKFQQW